MTYQIVRRATEPTPPHECDLPKWPFFNIKKKMLGMIVQCDECKTMHECVLNTNRAGDEWLSWKASPPPPKPKPGTKNCSVLHCSAVGLPWPHTTDLFCGRHALGIDQ